MIIINSIHALKVALESKKHKKRGFVPTMGALHQGHLTLIERSIAENQVTIVSIFVNPTQFNKKEDLDKYPRNVQKDIDILKNLSVDFLYTPTVEEMYPKQATVGIKFGELAEVLEGAHRPGHFDGVGLVVSKLFHQVQPTTAYFGLKDFQQYSLIKQMNESLDFGIEIVGVPIVRNADGLALSSRNARLSKKGLNQATILFRQLKFVKQQIIHKVKEAKGNNAYVTSGDIDILLNHAKKDILGNGFEEVEYFDLVDLNTLHKKASFDTIENLILCTAASIEGVRLIDNLILSLD